MGINSITIDLKTVAVPANKTVHIDLGLGYTLESTEMLYQCLPDSEFEVSYGRNFHLKFQGESVLEFLQKDLGVDDAVLMDLPYRRNLYKSIQSFFQDRIGTSKAAWIQKNFVKEPSDVPPWQRKEPVRDITSEKYESVSYALNDEGNALRFQEECSGYLIYDLDAKEWMAWNVNHWEPAESHLVQSERFVACSVRFELAPLLQLLKKAESSGLDKNALKPLSKRVRDMESHINYSKKLSSMKSMADLNAASTMSVHLLKEGDTSLLACKNGIIDTKIGKFYLNEEADKFKFRYPTHYIDCEYLEGAKPELFLKHLQTIFSDNTTPDLKDYDRVWREVDSVNCFKRLLGYLLVSGNPEQLFLFLWGVGANGKSTTIDVLREILGTEIAEASSREIYASKDDKPSTGITRGLSQRILLFSELSDDESNSPVSSKVSTEQFKNLTGDKKTACFRAIYEGSCVRDIICTPVALTNNLPFFDKGLDDALLRRIITVPHMHVFKEEERDKGMVEKLLNEKDAIFSLLIDELIAYREDGLVPIPEHWKSGQAQLLAGEAMYSFISEMYQKTDGSSQDKRIAMRIIEGTYIPWARTNMIDCPTSMRTGGIDSNGYATSIERLSNGEIKKMHKAFRAMGYTIKMYSGSPYVWCELKSWG